MCCFEASNNNTSKELDLFAVFERKTACLLSGRKKKRERKRGEGSQMLQLKNETSAHANN